MKKIRIGNDFVFNWAIERGGLPEDLSSVLEKHLHLSVFGKRVELVEGVDYDITGNVIRIEVTPAIANIIGTYKAEFHYILPDNGLIDEDRKCAVDVDAFQIVAKTAQADDSTELSMTSDMAIAFKGDKGDSAYQVWLDAGNTGTEEDYFAYLRQPATDIAETVNLQEQARVDAEIVREQQEQDRQTNTATAITNAETATANANTAAQNADDARLAIQDDLAQKADHGYETSPKTLKQVDDSLVQLESDVNKKTDGAWAINKDDWANVADAVIDVRIELDTTIKDISIENVRTNVENILLTVRYSYWNGTTFSSASYGLVHELGSDNINTAEWFRPNIKSIKVTYIKSRLKTATNSTKVQVKDANIVVSPIPRIVQSIGNLKPSIKNDVILKVESLTSHLPGTFVITRLRNTESSYFYVVAEIDGVQYTYSGRTELYTGITPVPLSSFIIYVNADSIAGDNYPLAIEINPLEIQQSIGAVEGMAEIIPAGENIIKELTESSVDDESLWGQGYLQAGGTISGVSGGEWVYSKKYYYVPKGRVTFTTRASGNANIIGINKLGEIKLALNTYNNTVDITEDLYVKISHRKSQPTSVLEVYSNTPLTVKKEPINIVRGGLNAPVSSDGVISFMKDIFKESIQKPKLPYPIVTFIMDDGNERDEWVISILDSKKVKGTFAIPTQYLVTPWEGRLTPERIIELYRDGHDIASHTYSNRNAGDVTIEEYELEMIKSKLFMMQCGIESNMHVPVQGTASVAVQNVIRKYYECSFVTNNNAPANIPPINNNIITRRSFDAGENNVSTLQRSKGFVDDALISREWLIFTIHPAYPEYSLPDGQGRRDEFAELIDYIKLQGIPILTAKRAYQYYKNIFEFKTPNSTEYEIIGMDGSE